MDTRHYFSGHLYPTKPCSARLIPNLYALNERVVLSGEWRDGYFALCAVGATNVGSITLSNSKDEVHTNDFWASNTHGMGPVSRSYTPSSSTSRGDEMAAFNMGSTVVLVFER